MRALVMAGLAVTGCAYRPGSFHFVSQPFDGMQTTIDCLDVALERRPDLPSGEAVIAYAFGNRCERPALVDLSTAGVVGRTSDGERVSLVAYDPRHEILAMWVDGGGTGEEAIAYQSGSPLTDICVDAASIARAPNAQWLCLAARSQTSEVP